MNKKELYKELKGMLVSLGVVFIIVIGILAITQMIVSK